ncbi:MAG: hypothetical protein L6R41_003390 [Letrouitia leprolyta]|nr:MAG: hypothetical protein L6R41_003390 [Letrouitia leprolyta]
MAPQPSEADIIFNRANVALAKSQRLVASWLPPRTEEEIKNAKTEEEIEREEQELFTPVPELLGLGAKPPEDIKDGDPNRQKLTSNDLLRRQLLGKDHTRLQTKSSQREGYPNGHGGAVSAGSKPRPQSTKRKVEEENSGDEDGRSSLGKKKQRKFDDHEGGNVVDVEKDSRHEHQDEQRVSLKHSKVTGSYIDEILSQREKKRKKKKANHPGDSKT